MNTEITYLSGRPQGTHHTTRNPQEGRPSGKTTRSRYFPRRGTVTHRRVEYAATRSEATSQLSPTLTQTCPRLNSRLDSSPVSSPNCAYPRYFVITVTACMLGRSRVSELQASRWGSRKHSSAKPPALVYRMTHSPNNSQSLVLQIDSDVALRIALLEAIELPKCDSQRPDSTLELAAAVRASGL